MPGAIRGFHVPLKKYAGLGACYRPRSMWTTRTQSINVLPASDTIWSSVTTTSACYIHGLYHRFRYLHLTSYLALTQSVVTRRVRLSRFAPRTTLSSCFVTLSGQLFIHAPRFTRWYGRSPTLLWGQLLQATSCRRWMRYCGTVAKAGGNSEHQLHPAALEVSSLLTMRGRYENLVASSSKFPLTLPSFRL